ncbi:neuropeptides B/W receptor type 2-like isoform X2 [Ciona intestinalis]
MAATGYEETVLPKIVFSGIICGFGLVGNLGVVFVNLVWRDFAKSTTHWYVLQLALADSMFLFTLPFQMLEDINGGWKYPEWMCKGKETILFLNYYASILFLTIMALDRYVAVCKSFSPSFQNLRGIRVAVVTSIVVWIACLLMTIPVIKYSHKVGVKGNCTCGYKFPHYNFNGDLLPSSGDEKHCNNPEEILQYYDYDATDLYLHMNNESHYDVVMENHHDVTMDDVDLLHCHYWSRAPGFHQLHIINFTIMFILPLAVMCTSYGLIIRRMTSSRTRSSSRRGVTSQAERDIRRITIMCASLVVCFTVCWLPYHTIHLAKIVGIHSPRNDVNYCRVIPIVSTMLAYSNSMLNPYFYIWFTMDVCKRFAPMRSVDVEIQREECSNNMGTMRMSRITSDARVAMGNSRCDVIDRPEVQQ